jgi:hypothetical protein
VTWHAAPAGHAPARASAAQESRWTLGIRTGTWLGTGEPANDLPIPAALVARYRLREHWWLNLALESSAGDFEKPHEVLGIMQDPSVADIDADASYTSFLASLERSYREPGERHEFYWLVGAGLSSVDVDDAGGPVQGGGTFDVATDAGTEVLASLGGGYRRWWESWAGEALLRFDYHLADWAVSDSVSGALGSVDDYHTWALLFGLSYRIP